MKHSHLVAAMLAAAAIAPAAARSSTPQGKGVNCNTLRVIPITLTDTHLRSANTIPDEAVQVCREDMVAWHFINDTEQKIDIDLEGFHVCGDAQKKTVRPLNFKGWSLFDDDSDASVQPRRSVTMVGRVKMRGGPNGTCVKYTISVKGTGGTIKHDPRLEIADPGT